MAKRKKVVTFPLGGGKMGISGNLPMLFIEPGAEVVCIDPITGKEITALAGKTKEESNGIFYTFCKGIGWVPSLGIRRKR